MTENNNEEAPINFAQDFEESVTVSRLLQESIRKNIIRFADDLNEDLKNTKPKLSFRLTSDFKGGYNKTVYKIESKDASRTEGEKSTMLKMSFLSSFDNEKGEAKIELKVIDSSNRSIVGKTATCDIVSLRKVKDIAGAIEGYFHASLTDADAQKLEKATEKKEKSPGFMNFFKK